MKMNLTENSIICLYFFFMEEALRAAATATHQLCALHYIVDVL